MKIIVTAGGQGTKLWPYSRESRPKQFYPIIGDKTLFSETINTLLKRYAPEDIYLSSKHKFIKYLSDQAPQIPLKNYIIEPDIVRDRGPAEGLAFVRLSLEHPDEPFFVVQADCVRQPETAFLQMIEDAGRLVAEDRTYISGGIKATEPNMGVDYLQLGRKIDTGLTQEVYQVDEFIGRRDSYRETRQLIENYHIVAHCNHSCWYPDLMLEAYKQYRPDWYAALMDIKAAIGKPGESEAIERIYTGMERGSTEEVTKHVMKTGHIILLPYKWADIGTWGSVYEFFASGDGRENYTDGNVVTVDSEGSIIKVQNDRKLVAVAGVKDLVIVDTEDALLVVPKDRIEKIKDIQKQLAQQDGDLQGYL